MRYDENERAIKELMELSDQFDAHESLKETREALIIGMAAIEYADQRGVSFFLPSDAEEPAKNKDIDPAWFFDAKRGGTC